jgi:hypothetical protein
LLKGEPDTEVTLVNGGMGELTISVNDRVVAKKRWYLFLPKEEQVLKAVREADSAATTS